MALSVKWTFPPLPPFLPPPLLYLCLDSSMGAWPLGESRYLFNSLSSSGVSFLNSLNLWQQRCTPVFGPRPLLEPKAATSAFTSEISVDPRLFPIAVFLLATGQ
eukprot:2336741-Ditylum_brightwellii.AAC.1